MPFFSVVIPCYNRAEMAREAIESVLSQTFTDYEIVVVDDGSTDHIEEVVASYNGRVNYEHQPNSGVAAARNRGIASSTGEYICYLDSDDIWPDNKLAMYRNLIERYPEAKFMFSDFRKWNVQLPQPYNSSNSDIFPYIYDYASSLEASVYMIQGKGLLGLLMHGYPLYPSTFVVKRDVHDNFRWDPGILKSEDFNFVLRVSKNHPFFYIDEDLASVRVHDTNKSSDFLTKNLTNIRSMRLYRDLYASKEWKGACNYYISRRLFLDGRVYLSNGLYASGIKLIFSSLFFRENWCRLANKLWSKFRGDA